MAIDDKLLVRDFGGMGTFPAEEYDERVLRGRWVYYVAADRWGLGEHTRDRWRDVRDLGQVPLALLILLMRWLIERFRPRPWKVAVYRMGNIGVFNETGLRRVHLETLPLDVEPQTCIAELVARAAAGEFEPDA